MKYFSFAVLVGLLALGCGANPPVQPTSRPKLIWIELPPPDFEVRNPESIEELVALALLLHGEGRYSDAATYFQVLAQSQRNQFGEFMLVATAVSHLQAGDRPAFLSVMLEYRRRVGVERLATAQPEIAFLVMLEQIYKGEPLARPHALDAILPLQNNSRRR